MGQTAADGSDRATPILVFNAKYLFKSRSAQPGKFPAPPAHRKPPLPRRGGFPAARLQAFNGRV